MPAAWRRPPHLLYLGGISIAEFGWQMLISSATSGPLHGMQTPLEENAFRRADDVLTSATTRSSSVT